MNIASVFYFLFSALAATAAFTTLSGKSGKSNSKADISFSLFCFALTLWLFCFANTFAAKNADNALMWSKIGFIGIVFAPAFLLRFVYAFTRKIIDRTYFILFYFIAAASVVLNFLFGIFFVSAQEHFFGFYPQAGFLFSLTIFQVIYFTYLCSKNLKSHIRRPDLTAYRHRQIINIRGSLFLVYILPIDILLAFADIPIYPLGGAAMTALLAVIIISLRRYDMSDIKIIISRALILFGIGSIILSAAYFVWKYSDLWLISAAMTFVLSVIGTYIYRAAVDKALDLFLAEEKKYQNALIQAASSMAREHDLKKLLKLMSIMVIRQLKIKHFAVFLENKEKKSLECSHIRPSVPSEIIFSYSYMHPFIMFIRTKKRPFVVEDLPLYIINSAELPFRPAFIVPFFFDNGTNGFMVLSSKKDNMPYTRDDIRTFEALSRQTSLAIESCRFFEEFKHTQEKIFAAEKLASVGGLAEGVAHQINNRLNQFSMIAGELKYEIEDFIKANASLIDNNQTLKKTFDYITELSCSLTENIKRTDAVIKGILNYSRTGKQGTMFSTFSLKEVFDLSLELLKLKHKLHKDFKIEFSFQNNDDTIYGIRSQITEAVYNVIDNAYEAVKEKFEELPSPEKENYKPLVKVNLKHLDSKNIFSIEDNGCGIKDENISKIFAPFFTTKSSYKSGTGIGMYIVKRMIEDNHNGKISFESKYGIGTKMIFELPKEKDASSHTVS